jgi:UDP-N-acetylglucosamine 2-epimerase (non-hydrolysing)
MILLAFGTRPEYIKIDPLVKEFKNQGVPFRTLFTGQHTDLLKEVAADIQFSIATQKSPNRLSDVFLNVLQQFDSVEHEKFDYVLVQGDTTSALAVATAAFNYKIPVIHLEAGLRTYDSFNPYPEEFNRRAISALTTLHLCPTQLSLENLKKEGIIKHAYVVGNSVLDNLLHLRSKTSNNKVIVTLHRREKHHEIEEWFKAVEGLAQKNSHLEFELPAHPNPNVQKHLHHLKSVRVRKPYEHAEFVQELAACYAVITDSGGIQEESCFLRKPCVVCREYTERTESLGLTSILCKNWTNLAKRFEEAIKLDVSDIQCPYGDGKTAHHIIEILKRRSK